MTHTVSVHLLPKTNASLTICIDVDYEWSQEYHGHRDATQYLHVREAQNLIPNQLLGNRQGLEIQSLRERKEKLIFVYSINIHMRHTHLFSLFNNIHGCILLYGITLFDNFVKTSQGRLHFGCYPCQIG